MMTSESDRQVYLQLLRHYCGLHQLVVMGQSSAGILLNVKSS
jgi:hypothetical protein